MLASVGGCDGIAIGEARRRGLSSAEIAELLHCSARTVNNALRGVTRSFDVLAGRRRLSVTQADPPGKWQSRVVLKSRIAD